jgi:hypothetical protein
MRVACNRRCFLRPRSSPNTRVRRQRRAIQQVRIAHITSNNSGTDLDDDACTCGSILFAPNATRDRVEPGTRCAVDHARSRRSTGTKRAGICVRSCYRGLPPPLKGDKTMSTDYDAPRRTETDDVPEDSLRDLTSGELRLAGEAQDVCRFVNLDDVWFDSDSYFC